MSDCGAAQPSSVQRAIEFVKSAHDSWKQPGIPENVKVSWEQYLRQELAKYEAQVVCPNDGKAVAFDAVREAELREIAIRRKLTGEEGEFDSRCKQLLELLKNPFSEMSSSLEEEFRVEDRKVLTVEKLKQMQLMGLALSGGGIRSATFSLGILQALASLDLLKKADYLSTVSGGGYIGAWLAAWIKRTDLHTVNVLLNPELNKDTVKSRLRPERGKDSTQKTPEPGHADLLTLKRPIRYLRQYSNYLTPQVGIFSGDMWATAAIYTRNTSLNLLTVVALLGSVLLVPRFLLWIEQHGHLLARFTGAQLMWSAGACGGVVLSIIAVRVHGFSCKPVQETSTALTRWRWIEAIFSVPLGILAALTGSALWAAHLRLHDIWDVYLTITNYADIAGITRWTSGLWWPVDRVWNYVFSSFTIPGVAIMFYGMGLGNGFFNCFSEIAPFSWGKPDRPEPIRGDQNTERKNTGLTGLPRRLANWASQRPAVWMRRLLAIAWLASASVIASVAYSFMNHGSHLLLKGWREEMMMAFAPPLALFETSAAILLFIGLMGRYFPDARREWIGRFEGWLILGGIVWALLGTAAFFVPKVWRFLVSTGPGSWLGLSAAALWALAVLVGVLAANNPGTGRRSTASEAPRSAALDRFTAIAPFLFLVGAFAAVSLAIDAGLRHYEFSNNKEPIAFFTFLFVYIVLSLSVDINEFSMHHFYKNRLVRCYLGASNPQRRADGFTGFDARDDIRLAKFAPSRTTTGLRAYEGPYPVINAALNMTSGEDLAYQERQADSFIFTPLYCGVTEMLDKKLARQAPAETTSKPDSTPERTQAAELPSVKGYRPTTCDATKEAYAYPTEGIHLGSAMSISGAAVNPNWGSHTSPPVAFLLSVFNVRLGWWLGNPRDGKKWQRSSPAIGSAYELKELFGFADPNSQFVYLSDGGHFENLGIYELVRRRCKYIVACDGEEDHAFGFEGLGNAIRKVRADFGVDIDLDLDQLRPKNKISNWHCVVGKVHYEQLDKDREPGILVYIKASLTGDEEGDLLQYALRNAEFPHQSTADQWFDESQFESYRKLGYHVARSVFGRAVAEARNANTGFEIRRDLPEPAYSEARGTDVLRTSDLFNALHQRWFAPSEAIAKSFTRHGEQLAALMRRLDADKNLRFLDWQFYPAWADLDRFASVPTVLQILERAATRLTGQLPPDGARWLPNVAEELRAGFYFANSLFQLMENVYLDLDLDGSSGHPDNRGWINLFHHWAESGMVRVAWAMSAATFGARFQTFCRKELDLDLGKIVVAPLTGDVLTVRELEKVRPYEQLYPGIRKFALCISVKNPVDQKQEFVHRFGLVLIQGNEIVFLRVRRQFRTMGLARRTLNLLMLSGLGTGLRIDDSENVKTQERARINPAELMEFKRLFESVREA